MTRILFISHEASRTGAPILLFRLIEEIKKNKNIEILILLKQGGALQQDFEALAKTFIWNRIFIENGFERWVNIFRKKLGLRSVAKTDIYRKILLNEITMVDVIFNNTITNAGLLSLLPIAGKRIFTYIHELHVITKMTTSQEEVNYIREKSEVVFVPALAVRRFLELEYNFRPEKIKLLKYIIPEKFPEPSIEQSTALTTSGVRDSFIVGFCGTLDWRKGYDLMALIMNTVINKFNLKGIHFVWIGVITHFHDFLILKNDLKKLHLDNYATFVENQPNIQPYLQKLDVLVLPSREDAFPLVVLEAAREAVPCVYFDQAGGISEFCGNDAGIPIPYLDVDLMAEAVVRLYTNRTFSKHLGERAKQKIAEYGNAEHIVEELIGFCTVN